MVKWFNGGIVHAIASTICQLMDNFKFHPKLYAYIATLSHANSVI